MEFLHDFEHMARNEQRKVFRAMPLVVLLKILCSGFFVSSNRHSVIKSLNENHAAHYNLGFLLLFNPLFTGLFSVLSILKNVVESIRWTVELFNNQTFLTCNMSQALYQNTSM